MSLLTTTMATESQDNERLNGRWTKEEHQRFVEAIKAHGKNWKKVEEFVGTRSGAQIRSHAQKFFLKLEKEVKTNQKGKEPRKSSKKTSEGSISTSDNISDSGKSDANLKGNLSFNELSENLTEASENALVLPVKVEIDAISTENKLAEVTNVAASTGEIKVETDLNKLSKAQLLSKLKACEEKVDFFHQFVKQFTAGQTNTTSTPIRNPLFGNSYHHVVYLDFLNYFGGFNKTAKSLKISDFVDLSYKANIIDDNSYEIPAGKKKVKVL